MNNSAIGAPRVASPPRRPRRSLSAGNGLIDALILALLLAIVGIWLWGDVTPAPLAKIQEVVALAEPSPAAKAYLVDQLKRAPNPTEAQLVDMRRRVNDIRVTELSRSTTGDQTLPVPPDRAGTPVADQSAALGQSSSRSPVVEQIIPTRESTHSSPEPRLLGISRWTIVRTGLFFLFLMVPVALVRVMTRGRHRPEGY